MNTQQTSAPMTNTAGQDTKAILIAGMSHTAALQKNLDDSHDDHFAIVNLAKTDINAADFSWPFAAPSLLCLSLQGNEHNVFALFEHPSPFSVGRDRPGRGNRMVIPRNLFNDFMRERLSKINNWCAKFAALFPETPKVLICPPPPVQNLDAVVHIPDIFNDKLKNGFAPNDVRIAAYEAQVAYYRALAESEGMIFLPPPPEAVSEIGMLAPNYSGGDPTHGNKKYGRLVLDQINALAEGL